MEKWHYKMLQWCNFNTNDKRTWTLKLRADFILTKKVTMLSSNLKLLIHITPECCALKSVYNNTFQSGAKSITPTENIEPIH